MVGRTDNAKSVQPSTNKICGGIEIEGKMPFKDPKQLSFEQNVHRIYPADALKLNQVNSSNTKAPHIHGIKGTVSVLHLMLDSTLTNR